MFATLALALVLPSAHAACTITPVSPASASTAVASPTFQWFGNCTQYRVRFSPSPDFARGTTTDTPWRTSRSFKLSEPTWNGYQAGAWAGGVYWKVQGRDSAGALTETTGRSLGMDPDLDDDLVSVGAGDCDDNDATVYPGATEVCDDGVDNNCDGGAPECRRSGTYSLADAETIFYGEDAGDQAGTAVEIVRDLDGDGYDDIIVSAPENTGGGTGRGAVYVFYGPVPDGPLDLSSADAKLVGVATDDSAGDAIAATGDLDGDGYGEIIVSIDAHETTSGTRITGNGTAYIFYGPVYGEQSLASADATITGEQSGSELGFQMNAQCDVDGDGNDDLLLGAPDMNGNGRLSGAAYLVHGPIYGAMSASAADMIYYGETTNETAGHSIGCGGDLDGDGFDDVVIGGDENDAGGAEAGAVYVFYGPVAGGTVNLSATTADAKIIGENAGDGAGIAISGGSDLTGDGRDDLVLSAVLADTSAANSGIIYVVDSPVTGQWELAGASIRLTGAAGEQAGTFLSQVGDVDGDGYADLLVGARRADGGAADGGVTYLFYGPLSPGERTLASADAIFQGTGSGDLSGTIGSLHGDVNGDGVDDLLIGAPNHDGTGADAGAAYLWLGTGG